MIKLISFGFFCGTFFCSCSTLTLSNVSSFGDTKDVVESEIIQENRIPSF